MRIDLHLCFDGRCAEAFTFYRECFGGEIVSLVRWGETPNNSGMPPEWVDKVCHATFVAGDIHLCGVDVPPGQFTHPQGFFALLGVDTPTEAQRIFSLLEKGGRVTMPLQETFWAARYGSLVDRFGVPWEINCSPSS